MSRKLHSSSTNHLRLAPTVRLALGMILGSAVLWGTVKAGDILRGGASTSAASGPSASSGSATAAATAAPVPSGQDRLARTTQALTAVKQMQAAARALAVTGANNLKTNLPAVPVNSYLQTNGLIPALGVPKDLLNPKAGEDVKLWTGANLPTVATTSDGGSTTVTIKQTQQQAVLNWQSFNIGKNTTLNFDQTAGGTDVGQWIAFNKVGVTGSPSQILGSIKADGQVYVINPNGIIFGGSSQVNTHALVASSLPINDNLIQRGLLNNPDAQFLFSALSVAAGSNGTPIFTPTISDPAITVGESETYVLARQLSSASTPVVNYQLAGSAAAALIPVTDFTVGKPDSTGKTALTFTAAGLKKIKGTTVTVSYTPSADQYGDVVVNPGAQLSAPTTVDHVGGRIALIGANVTNAGTISTPDGQTILAAGLQVGMAAHSSSDPSLRGVDVYVGAVSDPLLPDSKPAGVATNGDLSVIDSAATRAAISNATTNPAGTSALGVISAPRGDVLITGRSVNQRGIIDSTTSIALNGRIGLVAAYDAVSSRGIAGAPPFFFQSTGDVVLGAGSVMRILPELESTETAVGTSLALRSQLDVQGANIKWEGNDPADPGATLFAPFARVSLDAGSWNFTAGGLDPQTGFPQNGTLNQFIYDSGKISLGTGALIDVSGSRDVTASVAENIIPVQLRGPELADSPLQRDGLLRGQTIKVDIRDTGIYNGVAWVGTPLADTAGYVGLIQRPVGELTTDGGTVKMSAGDAVTLQTGSTINVSGGWINYQGGEIQTTKLLTNGHVIDISAATPDQVYNGIFNATKTVVDPKWGTTHTSVSPLDYSTFSPGYRQGGNGGELDITAPTMKLAGDLVGKTYAGENQRAAFVPFDSSSFAIVKAAGIDPKIWTLANQPQSSALSLTFEKQYAFSAGSTSYQWYSPIAPDIYIQSASAPTPLGSNVMVLSSDLMNTSLAQYGGFGSLKIDNSADNAQIDGDGKLVIPLDAATGKPISKFGTITVAANPTSASNVTLQSAPGGTITLDAGNIVLKGGVVASGGQLNFTAHNFWQNSSYSLSNNGVPDYDPSRGNITVNPGVKLSTAGLVADDRTTTAAPGTAVLMNKAGSVSLAGSNVTLGAGSILDVSGGAAIDAKGKVTYGAAGSISLRAGQDPASSLSSIVGGVLTIPIENQISQPTNLKPLQGYSGTTGGDLSITAPLIQIGSSKDTPTVGTLVLPADLFSEGGFSSFTVKGIGRAAADAKGNPIKDPAGNPQFLPAVSVTEGAVIHPRVQQLQFVGSGTNFQSQVYTAPVYLATPVSLSLVGSGVTDPSLQGLGALKARGDVVVGAGASLVSDPGTTSAIILSGQTVTVLGSLSAPGGNITIAGGKDSNVLFADTSHALPTVDLGPKSSLSAAGTTVLSPDINGLVQGNAGYSRTGTVLAGGSIALSGNIVAEAGSVVDVSGWSDTKDAGGLLNLLPVLSGTAPAATASLGTQYVPTVVDTNGGKITFAGSQELFVDATLKGAAGGTGAAGGSLSISSGLFLPQSVLDVNLSVSATGLTTSTPFYEKGQTAIGHAVLDKKGKPVDGLGYFTTDRFTAGGFDSLTLKGVVSFKGPVDIAAGRSIAVGDSGIIFADGSVNLSAPYVALGQPYQPEVLPQQFTSPFLFGGLEAFVPPTYGGGTLTVSAGSAANPGLVDVGNLSLQNIGSVGLIAQGGDVRGYGTFDLAGALTVNAGLIYPPTASTFNIAVSDYRQPVDRPGDPLHAGSVKFISSGDRPRPLSAGGTLTVHASIIDQEGTLRAPIGTIDLGWNGSGTAPIDPVTGVAFAVTQQLTVGKGSVTSVSAADGSGDAQALPIPYGVNVNGTTWVDPIGADITTSGLPEKVINLSAGKVEVATGALIDTSGGGDLYAYQFIPGVGGTHDLLGANSAGFAVIPSYTAQYAPDARFNSVTTGNVANLAYPDIGYYSVDASGNSRLAVGDQIHIDLNNGLGPRDYTLLPARYALLPGAYLVTPQTRETLAPSESIARLDGSRLVAGYRFNAFHRTSPLYTAFEVAQATRLKSDPSTKTTVVRTRAQYADYSANSFFASGDVSPASLGLRIPVDSGQLVIDSTAGLSLAGTITAQAATGGRSGLIDISSPQDIVINNTGTGTDAGTVYLSSSELSGFGAGSLLVGGIRTTGVDGTRVKVAAGNVTVDNAGGALTGPDVILVANKGLTVAAGADIHSAGTLVGPADALSVGGSIELNKSIGGDSITFASGGVPLTFPRGTPAGESIKSSVAGVITLPDGTSAALLADTVTTLVAGSQITLNAGGTLTGKFNTKGDAIPISLGDGALLRVSSDASARTIRPGVTTSTIPTMVVGKGAKIAGGGIILDSSNATTVDATASLTGTAIALNSGRIGIQFSTDDVATKGLLLKGAFLATLQNSAKSLSLLSYSSIDIFGAGQVGLLDANGKPALTSLALHAGTIRGDGHDVTFNAGSIELDNSSSAVSATAGAAKEGTLTFNADTISNGGVIRLGATVPSTDAPRNNQLVLGGFEHVTLKASNGVIAQGSGGLNPGFTTTADLDILSPTIVGATGANQTIATDGVLRLAPGTSASTATLQSGLGATLTLQGKDLEVAQKTSIILPSGTVTLHATDGDLTMAGAVDVGGRAKTFNDLIKYTNGGSISLVSDQGNVNLTAGGSVRVAAPAAGGSAGILSVAAPTSRFLIGQAENGSPAPVLDGHNGQGGTFKLDVASLSNVDGTAGTSLTPTESVLAAGGFSLAQDIRIRVGSVDVDSTVKTHRFALSADHGSITVTDRGSIDASGPTGGSIDLAASGSVTLQSGALLSVRGMNFDNAGKGGQVSLEAGSFTNAGETPGGARGSDGRFAAGDPVVDIRAGSLVDLSVVNDHALQLNTSGKSSIAVTDKGVGIYFPYGTPGNDQVAFDAAGTITRADGTSMSFTATPARPFVSALAPGSTVSFAETGTISFASGSGGSIPVNLPSGNANGIAPRIVLVDTTDLTAFNQTGTLHLRAPQIFDGTGSPYDLRVNPIDGTIKGASEIAVEGFKVFDLTHLDTPGLIDATVQRDVQTNGAQFLGGLLIDTDGNLVFDNNGLPQKVAGHEGTMLDSLLANNNGLRTVTHLKPGAELINASGDISLMSTWDFAAGAVFLDGNPAFAENWDLSGMRYRYGADLNEAGILRLRAAGNLILGFDPDQLTFGSLSDGFGGFDGLDNSTLWQAVMLPAGSKTWSYQLVSGADFTAADSHRNLPYKFSSGAEGSLILGQNIPALPVRAPGSIAQAIVPDYFQTIRTGTGSIGIYAAGDVQFLNNLATVYTAGTQADPLKNFDLPVQDYAAHYTVGGGNISIVAQGDIAHLTATGAADSSKELPINWLNRRGWVDPQTGQFGSPRGRSGLDSTSWWVDFSNFFEGVGALGGGNVTLTAGRDIANVDVAVPTNARMVNQTITIDDSGTETAHKLAAEQALLQLGGGDLTVKAGRDIDGGVYYVERGNGVLAAGNSVHTNATRAALGQAQISVSPKVARNSASWLPTSLFLGNGSFDVSANADLLLGPVANPFLLPQPYANGVYEKNYFSTFATSDVLRVSSLNGNVTIKDHPDSGGLGNGGAGSLTDWLNRVLLWGTSQDGTWANSSQPWLRVVETDITPFTTSAGVMPASLYATAFSGDINLVGGLTLSPAPRGQIELSAAHSINGVQPNTVNLQTALPQWGSAVINLSDADPANIPGPTLPLALSTPAITSAQSAIWQTTNLRTFDNLNSLFAESGSSTGAYGVIQTKQALHAAGPLHLADREPVRVYATAGDISGLTMFAGKTARVVAGRDISDVAFYLQNNLPTDVTSVVAGRDISTYNPNSALRSSVGTRGEEFVAVPFTSVPGTGSPTAGDIQIGGPGTLEVIAGRNLSLGVGPAAPDGTSIGITSIGNTRNPGLPFAGADIVAIAGIDVAQSLSASRLDFKTFIEQFLDPATAGTNATRYLPELAKRLGLTIAKDATAPQIWDQILGAYTGLTPSQLLEKKNALALEVFYLVLRDAGRDRNDPKSPDFRSYASGYKAIKALYPGSATDVAAVPGAWAGDLSLATRLIETTNGGNITIAAPGGEVTVGRPSDLQKADQGLLTAYGGNISIFASGSVNVGTSRIFTLRGGDEIIWSTTGNIAAGSGSKTVKSAPPTRVLIDPQSGNVKNDLAGLATGGGIGVLATLSGVAAGDVDLIAPVGTVDAGDAGIRSSGNLNIAAAVVLNASNIQVGGATVGTPPPPPAPNLGALSAATTASAGATTAATEVAKQNSSSGQATELPSLISVEVLGYGGDDEDEETSRKNPASVSDSSSTGGSARRA